MGQYISIYSKLINSIMVQRHMLLAYNIVTPISFSYSNIDKHSLSALLVIYMDKILCQQSKKSDIVFMLIL